MMRHLIRIVEAAIFGGETPINRAAAERVAEILGQHVHVGAASLQEMAELMRLLPRPATAIRLWRVLGINGQQEKALRAGQTVRLGDRAFQSWTKDADTLPRIAADVRSRTRAASVVIVEETVQPEQVVVDVMAFLDLLIRHDEFHGIDTYELRRYGRGESEVIVRHPEPLVLSQDNTRFWQPEAQRRPQAGESMYRRWDNEGDSAEEITEVPEDQPDAEHGFWTVESTGGGGIIHWTGHEWEEVE